MSSGRGMFGPYRLDQMLGRGGMGEVYRAFDTDTERVVAVKRLAPHLADDPEFQRRFRREARIVAQLRSPYVIPIHRFGEIDGQLYIDMRLVEGGDLHGLIEDTGGLALDRAVTMLEQIAHALDDAHSHGLVHRDVKPSNIMLDAGVGDLCYLGDFGVTRDTENATSHSLTRTGALLGSLAYMAPEQFDGALTKQSDVYSLTCVFFEMITGVRPYAGEGLAALMHSHMKIPPPRPSERKPEAAIFDDLVAAGMAKDVTARFDSAGALARAARRALTENRAAPPAAPTAPVPRVEPATPRSPTRPPTSRPPTSRPPTSGPPQERTEVLRRRADVREASPAPPRTAAREAARDAAPAPVREVSPAPPRRPATPPAAAARESPRRRWLLPAGIAVLVLALIGTTWAMRGGGSGATPPTVDTGAPAQPPILADGMFVGRTGDSGIALALGVHDGKASGYLANGETIDAWLEGTLSGDRLTLHGDSPDTGVTATVTPQAATGTVTVAGSSRPFTLQLASGPAGLFQGRRTADGVTTRIGWVVLSDGSQVGVRERGTDRGPAPPLNPASLVAVDDGHPVLVERLPGGAGVLGG